MSRPHLGSVYFATLLAVCVLALGLAAPAEAQVDTVANLPGITIETSVDRADMFIGDIITYRLTIIYDSSYELVPPPLGANLGAFDVRDYQTDILSRLEDGRMKSENVFKLSTFTTGDYVIPPIPARFNLPDGNSKIVLSEGVPITVKSLLGNESDSADIRPLKPPHEFQRDLTMYYIYGGLALLVIVLAALLLWRRYRRCETAVEPVDRRPKWEIAFERLAMLQGQNLVEQELYKQYYIELSEIAREYLGWMYQVDVLEMTTEEILEKFSDIPLPGDWYDTMRTFFTHADLVKFAKYVPARDRATADFHVVHDLVEAVRAEYQRRQQTEVAITSNDQGQNVSTTGVAG
jgi:hypothetical protein